MSSAELTLTGRQVGNIYMSGEEVAACRSVFDIVDEDGSGCIAAAEIQKLLRLLRLPARQSEVLRMVEEIDKDGSGDVDFEEFLQVHNRAAVLELLACGPVIDTYCAELTALCFIDDGQHTTAAL